MDINKKRLHAMSEGKNDLTVVVTTFYRWPLVASLVESLAHRMECKILVVNDGGDIASPDILNRIDALATILNLEENVGQARAIDAGAKAVTTSHMLYIDSDDTLELLENEFDLVAKLESNIVLFPRYIEVGDRRRTRVLDEPVSDADFIHTIGTHSGFIISLEAYTKVGAYDPALASHIDWDYIIRLKDQGVIFDTYECRLLYSTEPGGISRNLRRVYCGRVQIWAKHRRVFPNMGRLPDYLRLLKYSIGNCAIEPFRRSDNIGYLIFKSVHFFPRKLYLLFKRFL